MKTVLIDRAVTGSGKTTFAKNIFAAVSSPTRILVSNPPPSNGLDRLGQTK